MDNSFSPVVDAAASILVLLPVKPNFDQVTAGLSLYLAILGDDKTNHQVTIYSPSPMMVGFNRVIGINKIVSEIGNKNLTLKFKGYEAANIEKVSYDIINGEFNLTVVPKVGFSAPTKDQLDVSYSGISADLIILVGGTSETDFPALATDELAAAKIVHIGNRSLTSNREVMSMARPASTLSESVAFLIRENSMSIDPDIATNLLMGIEEGSSNFSGSEVTPDTFETFAYLLRSGGRRQSKVKLSPMGFPPGAIPNQPFNIPLPQRPVVSTQPLVQNTTVQPPQTPQETDAMDVNGTGESEQEINPPDDWLQPKVFKGSNVPMGSSDSFSENKG